MQVKEKRKIFVFWIGDQTKLSNFAKRSDVEWNIGPTSADHSFLMSVSPYYRLSFELGKYSFCSDVWRFWKLSENKGLYIDVSVNLGPNFTDFIDEISQYDVAVFRGNTHIIETSVLWSGKENNKFFKGLFDIYCDVSAKPWNMYFAPIILSSYIQNEWFTFSKDFEENINNGVAILSLLKIRDNNTIKKIGACSWGNVPVDFDYFEAMKSDHWSKWEETYKNKIVSIENVAAFNNVTKFGYFEPDINMVRRLYDTVDRKYLSHISKDAKKMMTKVEFKNKLIWSKIFRFFKK